MNTEKIISGKDSGLTYDECIDMMDGTVYQYRVAGVNLYYKGYYLRGRTQNSRPTDGGGRGNVDIYILTKDGIETLCYNTTSHRAYVALNAYKNGLLDNVDDAIWGNYIHNGYSTRSGLHRSTKKLERIMQMSRSHADYLGSETFNSSIDHKNRVAMRNN